MAAGKFRRCVILALIAGVVAIPPSLAAEGKQDNKPLVIEEGVLDAITLKTATMPAGVGVIVRRFPSDKADFGTAEKGDNPKRVEAAKMIQGEGPRILAEAMLEELADGGGFAFARESTDPAPEKSIVIEGRFVLIDPGSKAKRYWAGFGAGKSGVGVEGTVKSADGTLLAEFRHRRHSGIGLAGGDYVKFLTDDTRDVGHDIAVFLKRWAAGGDLKKGAD